MADRCPGAYGPSVRDRGHRGRRFGPGASVREIAVMANDCLFCRIVKGEIPAKVVAQNDHCVAFNDINPQAPTHVVIVPREHIASLNEAKDAATIGHLSLMAAEIARSSGLAERGYRTVVNTNADAGQTVFHVHLHLIGGRRMGWPPG